MFRGIEKKCGIKKGIKKNFLVSNNLFSFAFFFVSRPSGIFPIGTGGESASAVYGARPAMAKKTGSFRGGNLACIAMDADLYITKILVCFLPRLSTRAETTTGWIRDCGGGDVFPHLD